MPKMIENLEKDILHHAKELMMKKGYEALTIRAVAAKCGIGVGTVYNYYTSKDVLAACVMLEDWEKKRKKAEKEIAGIEVYTEGLCVIFETIRSFSSSYARIWKSYGSFMGIPRHYHDHLVQQVAELVHSALRQKTDLPAPDPSVFLAEVLLSAGIREEVSFEAILPFLERLCR